MGSELTFAVRLAGHAEGGQPSRLNSSSYIPCNGPNRLARGANGRSQYT